MPSPMIRRIRAEEKAARWRRWKRGAGVLMMFIGAFEIASSMIFGTAPQIYRHITSPGPLTHLVIGIILIAAGGILLSTNQE